LAATAATKALDTVPRAPTQLSAIAATGVKESRGKLASRAVREAGLPVSDITNMKIKYATKEQLVKINKRAIEKNYNRAVEPEYLDALNDTLLFPICFEMLHEHAQGKPVEPHVRCMFVLSALPDRVLIDVEMGMYEMLDEHDDKKPEKLEIRAMPFSVN